MKKVDGKSTMTIYSQMIILIKRRILRYLKWLISGKRRLLSEKRSWLYELVSDD